MRDRGWLTMHGDTFAEFLQRAADGEEDGMATLTDEDLNRIEADVSLVVAAKVERLRADNERLRAGVLAHLRSLACCDECYDLGKRSYLWGDARALAELVDDL